MNNLEKRIALMTWYKYNNYGTALQASAMCKVIQEHVSASVDLINYSPKGNIEEASVKTIIKKGKNFLKKRLNKIYSCVERETLFLEYLNQRTNETVSANSWVELNDLNDKYSAFVCGSDQIWSPLCFDDKFFLSFVDNTDKMVAYAPSLGSTKVFNPHIREKIIQYVSRFKHISVREQHGAEIIKELTGQEAKVVLDPTLLLNSTQWNEYVDINKVKKVNEKKYIICYFLGESEKYMAYVRSLAKQANMPFYIIPVTINQKKSKNSVPFEVGPSEFVSLISNASYVCTDSFHGMAFSINYNIPFSVFKRFKDNDSQNQNSRIFSLAKILQLEDRIVDYKNNSNLSKMLDCNFENANRILNEERESSFNFLTQAIKSCIDSKDDCSPKASFKITDMCCGCGACASVCNKNAITISMNADGFQQCFIDNSICVSCGNCKTVCPMTNVVAAHMKDSNALYSVKSKSDEVLKKSSSGGIGHELALQMLKNGYAVFGCMYNSETNSAEHICITPKELDKLHLIQGSKYIQSSSDNVFKIIPKIAEKYKIAFFGTPCQVAAVDKLLCKKNIREGAILVDLICHGVPSYHLWSKHLKALNIKHKIGEHPYVLFRSKEKQWRNRLLRADGNNKIYRKSERKDDFYAFFRRGLCHMRSCYDCPYREKSAADLRIGDYWGNRFAKDKQGVSMVVANSDFGNSILCQLEKDKVCNIQKHDLNEYWDVQYPYNQNMPLIRNQLISELKDEEKDLHNLRNKYCRYFDIMELLRMIKNIIKRLSKR